MEQQKQDVENAEKLPETNLMCVAKNDFTLGEIAISQDERFVYLCETQSFQTHRGVVKANFNELKENFRYATFNFSFAS